MKRRLVSPHAEVAHAHLSGFSMRKSIVEQQFSKEHLFLSIDAAARATSDKRVPPHALHRHIRC